MRTLEICAATLFVTGGLNWGLVRLLDVDPAAALFGDISSLGHVVYALVGLLAMHHGLGWQSIRQRWGVESATA